MKALAWAALPLGALVVLLLFNLGETDYYEFGTETPPPPGNNVDPEDATLARVFPDFKYVHACPGCGECVHRFESIENRRVLTLHDHDGWYKVFWAADEEYYYVDPVQMLADWGRNRTAGKPAGTWTIRLKLVPPTHPPGAAHDCGQVPQDIRLIYTMEFADKPIEESTHSGDGPLKILATFPWLIMNSGKLVCLNWRLSGPPTVDVAPCACSRP
ncbi:MAG TPA: hypothetical protein VE981_14445 [Planctomycetota bacterium]|nr:hypothetical protein [Planctomycetota bacterium]